MGKSIRSKVKKANRTVMRETVGKDFTEKMRQRTLAIVAKDRAAAEGSGLGNLRGLLTGSSAPTSVTLSEPDRMDQDGPSGAGAAEDTGAAGSATSAGANVLPGKHLKRGTNKVRPLTTLYVPAKMRIRRNFLLPSQENLRRAGR